MNDVRWRDGRGHSPRLRPQPQRFHPLPTRTSSKREDRSARSWCSRRQRHPADQRHPSRPPCPHSLSGVRRRAPRWTRLDPPPTNTHARASNSSDYHPDADLALMVEQRFPPIRTVRASFALPRYVMSWCIHPARHVTGSRHQRHASPPSSLHRPAPRLPAVRVPATIRRAIQPWVRLGGHGPVPWARRLPWASTSATTRADSITGPNAEGLL